MAAALPIHLSASSACPLFAYSTRCMWHPLQWLYTCWLHSKALARITQLSCICTDPQLSYLHWFLNWFIYTGCAMVCIRGITDCSALLTHRSAGALFATCLHAYPQCERPCLRIGCTDNRLCIDQRGDCCTVFSKIWCFLLHFRIQLHRLHIGSH